MSGRLTPCPKCNSMSVSCQIIMIEAIGTSKTKVCHSHRCLDCGERRELIILHNESRERVESQIEPCVHHIQLGTTGPIPANRLWHHAIYPSKNLGCCILELLLPTPSNKKELEDFLVEFDNITSIFREHCLSQLRHLGPSKKMIKDTKRRKKIKR